MSRCKVCNKETKQIISFGKMPIANAFLKNPADKEFFYNLSVAFCPACFMTQLEETVKPEVMFHANYQFISSTSKVMEAHFEEMAEKIIKRLEKKKDPFVVELGCNDGIMLKHIAKRGIKHLGVEPAGNVAAMARKNKVKVLEKFFNEKTALEIVKKHGQAEIICGANVFCHIEEINSVFKGVNILLKKAGLLFFEEPYLQDIIKKSSFDQIYDEHVYYFSGLSISSLAKRHNMQLVDMRHQDVHGGSMRYYLKKGKRNRINPRVKKYLLQERKLNLDQLKGYLGFKKKVNKICRELKQLLVKFKKEGNQIVGYGATSKSTTLLNYAKIGPKIIDYISDITPSKIGKYSPGMHISIKSHESFIADQPPSTLLLAWNHKKEIFEKEKKYRQKGGKFILYFPKVVVE